jgi:hypothetical protein
MMMTLPWPARRHALLQHIFAYMACTELVPGAVTLQLWERGRWRRIVIDDRLPCGRDGQPLYARSLEPSEFWVALLEKAFAKRYGSYEALISGFADGAMRDLTGGAPQRLRLSTVDSGRGAGAGSGAGSSTYRSATSHAASGEAGVVGSSHDVRTAAGVWALLQEWTAEGAPIGCAFSTAGVEESSASSAGFAQMGLLRGHAYGLEMLAEVAGRRLLRLRNPWGRGEWTGPWSDEAPEVSVPSAHRILHRAHRH